MVDQRADPQPGADRSASSKKSFAETLGWPQFAVKLANVRDAVLALPSIPSRIWLGGFIVLVMGCALRVWLFNRRVRSAFAAPQSVVHLVREAAGSIGLRRLPGVFFVHDRIPPMVWGARHPRLFLPAALWAQLDPVGRRAVICHELAHLRRRDHWLCWADTLIGAIYWWHPVVWWVRHRLHDEAENCCDAWVTHLMPHDRRAYAEALLHAKQYVSTNNVRVPTVGIGVTKGRARRFARRITMVMTKRVAPRLSVWGLALAFLMGGAGWLTSPVWACPPKAKTSTLMVTAPKLIDTGTGNLVIAGIGVGSDKCAACCAKAKCKSCESCKSCKLCKSGPKCPKCEAAIAPYVSLGGVVPVIRTVPSSAYALLEVAAAPEIKSQVWAMATAPETISTFEQYLAGKDVAGKISYAAAPAAIAAWLLDDDDDDADDDDDDGFENRLRRLEKQMDRLGEHLEKIADRLEDGSRGRRGMRAPREPREPRAPREPRSPRGPRPPASWRGPGPFADVFGPEGVGGLLWRAPESDETMTRSYTLPDSKLEALIALMVLSDVPILVSPNDDHIDVHATARQQEVFAAFVDMIHPSPKKKAKAAKKDKKKKKAKSKGRGRVRGDRPDALNAVYNQYLAGVLHRAGAVDAQARAEQQYVGELQRYVTEIAESQNRAALRQYTLAVKQLRSVDRGVLIETVKTHAQSLQQRAMELAREAERLLEQAESLEMNADNLSVEAEILRSEASDIEDKDARTQTRRHANLIEKEVRAMAAEARRSNGEANKLENRAERLADAAEVLYDTISEILDRMTEDGAR